MSKWINWLKGLLSADSTDSKTVSHETEARYLVELTDLRRREKALIERAVDVVCTINSSGSFVFVSPSCKTAWGYEAKDLQGKSAKSVVDEEGYKRLFAYASETDKSIEKVIFETDIQCADGAIRHAAWRGQWSISEKTLFCIVHDMTEQKQLEQTLRSSEKQLKDILQTLPAGVLILDSSGKIEFANSSAKRLLIIDEEKLVGQMLGQFFCESFPDGQRRLVSNDRLAMRSDGCRTPVETHTDDIELGGHKKQIFLFVDKSALYDLERTKQEFFTMVAHDFRAPLTSLRNLVVLIEDGVLDKQSQQGTRVAEQVNLECNQLLRLVQDMVDIGKLGSNTFALEADHTDALAIVNRAVEGISPMARNSGVRIEVSKNSATVWCDELRLNQVITNLLTNAVKHSPPDSQVKVSLKKETSTDVVRFEVKDFGPGIPADKLDKVFEIYEQLSVSNGKPAQGTGLGLAICKLIVQRHGGQIGVESKVAEGSLFWFTIPNSPPDQKT